MRVSGPVTTETGVPEGTPHDAPNWSIAMLWTQKDR